MPTASPGGHVRFKELDYEAAVRAHFWDHMPDLRPHLGTWAARPGGAERPARRHHRPRRRWWTRLAEQYLRTGNGSDGLRHSRRSAGAPATAGRPRSGSRCPRPHLRPRRSGPRQGLSPSASTDWCANRRLTGEFAQVLVRVCADVLAVGHPDQALLRLYYLARRERGSDACPASAVRPGGTQPSAAPKTARSPRGFRTSPPPTSDIFLQTCDPLPLTVSLRYATRAGWTNSGVQTLPDHLLARGTDGAARPRSGSRTRELWLHRAAADTGPPPWALARSPRRRSGSMHGEAGRGLRRCCTHAPAPPNAPAQGRRRARRGIPPVCCSARSARLKASLTATPPPASPRGTRPMTTARKTTTVFLTVLCGLLLRHHRADAAWPAWAMADCWPYCCSSSRQPYGPDGHDCAAAQYRWPSRNN